MAETVRDDKLVQIEAPAISLRGGDGTEYARIEDGVGSGLLGGALVLGWFNVKAYGAKGDGKIVNDAAITNGTALLSSTQAGFTNKDVGKLVGVAGASTVHGGVLMATILSVSAGVATLSADASATVTGASCCFGTDDTAAIQAAIDACPTFVWDTATLRPGAGATVYLPCGVFVTSGAINTKDRVRILGAGPGQTIVAMIQDGGVGFTNPTQTVTTPGTGLAFEQFQIDATWFFATAGYTSSLKPLQLFHVKRVRCTDVWVVNSPATAFPFDESVEQAVLTRCLAYNPGRMNDGTQPGGAGFGMGTNGTSDSEPTTLTNCYAIGGTRYGIFIEAQGGTAATASAGYVITGCYCYGNQVGIGNAGACRTIITGNRCFANQYGIALDGGTLSKFAPPEVIVSNNVCSLNTKDGIRVYAITTGTPDLRATRIVDNICSFNAQKGVHVEMDTQNVAGINISSNTCYANGQAGLQVEYTGGTKTAVLQHALIRDNHCFNNNTAAGSSSGIVVAVTATDCKIDGNVCYDSNTSKKQTYGLTLSSTLTFTGGSISRNDFRGNATGTINNIANISASTEMCDNPGWNSGTGAPSFQAPLGTKYTRTDGTAGSILYVNTDGSTTWAAYA